MMNKEAQTKETAERTEANVAYQADVRNLVSAQSILSKAIKVLKAYYDDLEKKLAAGEALVQEDPTAPEAWKGDGAFKGQSDKGTDVIEMLKFILSETQKEEMDAHKDEEKSQADYEDSMAKLKKEEADAEKSLANLQEDLAEKENSLLEVNLGFRLFHTTSVSLTGNWSTVTTAEGSDLQPFKMPSTFLSFSALTMHTVRTPLGFAAAGGVRLAGFGLSPPQIEAHTLPMTSGELALAQECHTALRLNDAR